MGQKTLLERANKKNLDLHLILIILVSLSVFLFIPAKSEVVVTLKCTHGEPVFVQKKTVWRLWWLEPFLSNEVVETTLCAKHLSEERKNFQDGLKWYRKGAYELALYKFLDITYLNPQYEQAKLYIKKIKKEISVETKADKVTKSVKGYEYLFPREIPGYVSAPVFVGKDDGYEFLGTTYRAIKRGLTPEIQVSLYLFESRNDAVQFVRLELHRRYPDSRKTEYLRRVKVYFGFGDPYMAAVFNYGNFVYEITAVGRNSETEKIRDLKVVADYLIKVAQL